VPGESEIPFRWDRCSVLWCCVVSLRVLRYPGLITGRGSQRAGAGRVYFDGRSRERVW